MSNVIELIEKLGQDARLRHAHHTEVERAVNGAHIDPEVRAALLAGDQKRLETLLGANTIVCCGVYAPENEPSKGREDSEGQGRRQGKSGLRRSAPEPLAGM
jgi:hypothetical protein